MKLDLKKNNNFVRTLSIMMPWNDIKGDYQKEFNRIKSSYTPPGGRKGKVFGPALELFKKNYTSNIEAQFVDNAVNIYYKKALEELKIVPINQGKITNLDFKEGADLKFEITFEIKPKFSLPKYQKIKIATQKFIADKKDVKESLVNLQTQHAKSKSVNGKLKSGNFIYADFTKLDKNGDEVENSTMKNHYIKIGEGLFVGDLAKDFIGNKTGDTIHTKIKQDSGDINYKVKINKIEEQMLPELNDDFAQLVDPKLKGINELKERMKNNIQENLNNENKKEFNNKIIDYFLEKTKMEAPDSLIENYEKQLIEQYKEQYKQQGQKFDESSSSKQIKETAKKTISWHLIREKIIIQENIKISSDEIDKYIEDMIIKSPKHKKEIKKYYNDQNNKYNLHEEILNKKLFDILANHFINKVKEKSTDSIRKKK